MSGQQVSGQCPVAHDFDLFGSQFQSNPGGSLRAARAEQPVFYSPDIDYYVVTKYDDVRAVFFDHESFSPGIATEPIAPLSDPAVATLERHGFKKVMTLGVEVEPVHSRLRRRLSEPFSAATVRTLEPRIREVVNHYVDGWVKDGHVDLVAGVLHETPAVVALEFLGVPDEDIAATKQYAEGIIKFVFGHPTEDEQVQICDHMGQHQKYSLELVQRLIESPDGPGFLRHAVRAYLEDPQDLSVEYLSGLAMNGLAAAHETTSNSLANAFRLLLQHRDNWDAICDDPSLVPGAVEECLRLGMPVATWRHLCVKDTTIGGVDIPAGGRVLMVLASANHDEAIFENPEVFDIRRTNAKRQLAFGTGNHVCLGARLARMQMQVTIEELARRLPHMRLVPGQSFDHLVTAAVGGPLELFVEWDPAANPEPEDRP
ncbi:MAG TPA: cytochrome P450 [Ilumatobacter sp.]|nr:cytochrome P450 [Ilumatobacter sp.]